MSLDVVAVRRQSRQIALPEIGVEGQERIGAAEVALVGADLGLETAARYLAAAGVRRFRVMMPAVEATARAAQNLSDDSFNDLPDALSDALSGSALARVHWPREGPGWLEALRGATLVLRSGFDDDPMLRAAVRLGIPVVVMLGREDGVDLLSFRRHGPCRHADLDVPVRIADVRPEDGAGSVLAGALAATEALWILARPGDAPRARHLRLSLAESGGQEPEPVAQELPWAPECFICGGESREAVLS